MAESSLEIFASNNTNIDEHVGADVGIFQTNLLWDITVEQDKETYHGEDYLFNFGGGGFILYPNPNENE